MLPYCLLKPIFQTKLRVAVLQKFWCDKFLLLSAHGWIRCWYKDCFPFIAFKFFIVFHTNQCFWYAVQWLSAFGVIFIEFSDQSFNQSFNHVTMIHTASVASEALYSASLIWYSSFALALRSLYTYRRVTNSNFQLIDDTSNNRE